MNNSRLVLYVEDQATDAYLMQRAFKRQGILELLKVACDAEVAIRYLSDATASTRKALMPSLVLVDINLPMVSGFQVLQWIRNQAALKSLPVVMYSSGSHPSDVERAAALGATDYVEKQDLRELDEFVRGLHKYWEQGPAT